MENKIKAGQVWKWKSEEADSWVKLNIAIIKHPFKIISVISSKITYVYSLRNEFDEDDYCTREEHFILEHATLVKDVEEQREETPAMKIDGGKCDFSKEAHPTIHCAINHRLTWVNENSVPFSARDIFCVMQNAPDFKEWEREYKKAAYKNYISAMVKDIKKNAVVEEGMTAWKEDPLCEQMFNKREPWLQDVECLELKMVEPPKLNPEIYSTMKASVVLRTTKALEEDEEDD